MEQFDVSKLDNNDNNEKIEDNITKICGICGDPHFYRNCQYVILNSRINNKEVLTRARHSLPDQLQIKRLADETHSVFTKSLVEVGTEFGPFDAKKNLTLNPCTTFPIKIFIEKESDLSEYYLDTTNEDECCWMMFVKPASDVEEQNLICFQEEEDIFFSSIRDIKAGEELKVWYSPYYAFKMQKDTLSFKESSKLKIESEINRKETENLNTIIKEQQNIVPRVVWNCKFCYKLEKNVTDFARHLLSHYKLQKRKICPNCPKRRFRFMQDYRKHVKLCTGQPIDKNDTSPKNLLLTSKLDRQANKKPPAEPKTNTIGGPLLLQFSSDSMDNSNHLVHHHSEEEEDNLFDLDNDYEENQNVLLDSDNLRLNVDVIGNGRDLGDEFGGGENKGEVQLEKKEFVCDICLKKFMTVKGIYMHLKMHMGSYYCAACKKVFSRPENLKHHKCNLIYSYKCPLCERIFSQKKYLTKHTTVVHNKKFTCSACNRVYHSPLDLKTHVCDKVPQSDRRNAYACKICSKKFTIEKYLNRHVKRHKNDEEVAPTMKYICSECSVTFASQDNYQRHLQTLHNKPNHHDCHICDKQFSRKDTLKSHMINVHMLGPAQVYKCVQCNKDFKTKGALYWHLKVTHNDSNYTCHCGAVFKYSRNLMRHAKKVHGTDDEMFAHLQEEVHECPTCGLKVKLKRSLQRHIRQKHPGEYKKICVEVGAKKTNDEQQKRKEALAGGGRECPVCEMRVMTEVGLKKHVKGRHPKEYKAWIKEHVAAENERWGVKKKQKKVVVQETTKLFDDDFDTYTDTDQKCMDLQKTIENMDFSIDDVDVDMFFADLQEEEEVHKCPTCSHTVKHKRTLHRHIQQKHPGEYKTIWKALGRECRECPVCKERVTSEVGLRKHVKGRHPKDYKEWIMEQLAGAGKKGGGVKEKQKKVVVQETTKLFDDDFDTYTDTDQKCMDLQKTIENMDFSIDTSNENLLRGSDIIDKFLRESSEQISISFADSPKITGNFGDSGNTAAVATTVDKVNNTEVFLSMPDLSEMDQDIRLSKNAYISDNGNIIEPLQGNDSADVVLYVLK